MIFFKNTILCFLLLLKPHTKKTLSILFPFLKQKVTLEILQSGTCTFTRFVNQFNMLRVFSPGEARHDKLLLDSRHHYPRSNQVRTAALTSKEIMLATIYNFQVWHKKFTKHPKPTTIFNNPKLTFQKEDIFTALLTVPNSFRQRRRDNSACFYCQA